MNNFTNLNLNLNESNQSWENFFKPHTESDLIWCLDKSPINLRFHTVDRTILLFLRFLLEHKKDGFVVYPINKMNLMTPLAAEALFQRVPFKERKKILLIGKNMGLRESFRTLTNAAGHPLEHSFPIGVVRSDGKIYNQSKIKFRKTLIEPKILFTSSPEILPTFEWGEEIYAVIVEVDPQTLSRFRDSIETFRKKSGIPCVFWITSNPNCYQAKELLYSGIPVWGWNSDDLFFDYKNELNSINDDAYGIESNPYSAQLYQIKNAAEGVNNFVVSVEDEELNRMLIDAKNRYKDLIESIKEKDDIKLYGVAKDYLKVVHSFEDLTAPLIFSEREYSVTWGIQSIKSKIEIVKKESEDVKEYDSLFSSYMINAVEALEHIYNYFTNNDSGKPSLILQIIDKSIKYKKKTAVITKNQASKRALINYMAIIHKKDSEFLKKNNIIVESAKNADDLPDSDIDTFIFYGKPGLFNKNILRTANCKNIGFLAYNSEYKTLLYLLNTELNKENKLFSYEHRVELLSRILNVSAAAVKDKIKKSSHVKHKTKKVVSITSSNTYVEEQKIMPLSDELLSQDLSIDSEFSEINSFYYAQLGSEVDEINYKVKSNLIKLSSGKCIYIPFQKKVPIFIDSKNKVNYRKGKNLVSGDLLILINEGLRKSLAQEIIDTVDKHPQMSNIVMHQRSWIEALRRGMKQHNQKINDVFYELKKKGSSIKTPVAVYFWVSGEVVGPRDKDNIKLIGEIYQDSFLIHNFDKIYESIKRLRKIHGRLKRNLGRLMINAGLMIDEEDKNQIIDEELNLYLEDFANSIHIERISSVEGPFEINVSESEIVFDMNEGLSEWHG